MLHITLEPKVVLKNTLIYYKRCHRYVWWNYY